jgi:hypothetical protein
LVLKEYNYTNLTDLLTRKKWVVEAGQEKINYKKARSSTSLHAHKGKGSRK